jgi:hypothetical protein
MPRVLFLTAMGFVLLGIGGADSAYSETTTTSLAAGWNHVCYIGAEGSVEEALGTVAGSVQALYRMGANGALDRWFPGQPLASTIDTLAPEDALLMLVAEPVEWTQSSGETAPDSARMAQGWNSICYEGESRDIEEATEGMDDEPAIIYALSPAQGWLRFVPGRDEISDLEQVEPHQALLVLISDVAGATWDFEGGEIALPPLTPFGPSLEAKAHQIRDTMSSLRGLPPHSGIEEGTITRAALTEYYDRVAARERQEEGERNETMNLVFRLLHLIGPEDDLTAISTEFSSNILGFYDPSDDRLVLVAEESADIDTEDELTLAHEYVHSFQDVRFDIEKLDELAENEDRTRSNTEYGATVRCLIEGDAEISEVAYLMTVNPIDLLGEITASNGENGSSDIPPGMARYYYFPYYECADFVGLLFLMGGWDAVNNAYDDMPTSTEQILHLEKYTSHETPAALSLTDLSGQLGQGWGQLDDAVFGEFDVYNYLLSSLEGQSGWDDIAEGAAAGWGGGRMAVYTHEDVTRVVLHLSLQWDSAGDLAEFVDAFLQVAGTTAGLWWPNDPSISTVRWDGAAEHGFATWQGDSFVAVLSPSADDLRTATTAAGYDLDAATSPSLPAVP